MTIGESGGRLAGGNAANLAHNDNKIGHFE
jgi:hypothetical protein